MDGNNIIELAGHLVSNSAFGHPEARFRCAISRAYYGAFHLAVEFLGSFSIDVVKGPSGHEDVYRKLYNFGDNRTRQAASHLNDLRTERNNADYRLDRRGMGSFANAQEKVEMAHVIRDRLNECRESS